MKTRWIGILLAVCLTALLAGCAAEPAGGPASGAENVPETVVFADPVLERMVREQLGRPDGEITSADAEAVKELRLDIEWQPEIPEETKIRDLRGLESFKNLESLELQFHAISDISPLAGLTQLISLSLGGNPVADLSPLSGLTNLTWLTLFNCQAEDYAPLANLTHLGGLMLGYSTISDVSALAGLTELSRLDLANTGVGDVSPLAGLTNLNALFLAGCPIADYSPLAQIYPSLLEKDFAMPLSLAELGFVPANDGREMSFFIGNATEIKIGRPEWNAGAEGYEGFIFLFERLENGSALAVSYSPEAKRYDMKVDTGDAKTGYAYFAESGEYDFEGSTREEAEALLETVLGAPDSGDPLMGPVSRFNETLLSNFGIGADALYALPMEYATLAGLGFENRITGEACCVYTDENDPSRTVAVHHPEWGDKEWSVEYAESVDGRLLRVWYYKEEQRFYVRAEAADGSAADYEYLVKEDLYRGGMAPEGMSSEEYFAGVYPDPAPEDIYGEAIRRMEREIRDRFGLGVDELYALPAGE
ncbi:MAG TPA: hypothetical protein PLP20_00640 [Oscillospiraceae bacterium]|nr:hypothetical protein [Oscillospiraceae bacterium]HNW04003.1 hypothetical protein [Oscillospiraceae bacterium]HPV99550.1 hypothetical protein [Oscillospiraceae bacterium]